MLGKGPYSHVKCLVVVLISAFRSEKKNVTIMIKCLQSHKKLAGNNRKSVGVLFYYVKK